MNYKPGQKVIVNIDFHPFAHKGQVITLMDCYGEKWAVKELEGRIISYINEDHIKPISLQLEFDFKEG